MADCCRVFRPSLHRVAHAPSAIISVGCNVPSSGLGCPIGATPSALLKAVADLGAIDQAPRGELRKREEKPSGKPLPDLPSWVREQLQDLTGLLKSDPAKAKAEFRRLNLELTFHPTEAEPRAHYIVKGQCDLGALVFFYLRSRRQGAVLDPMRGQSDHSRTPVLLTFLVRFPSVTATGRWRERGRMHR